MDVYFYIYVFSNQTLAEKMKSLVPKRYKFILINLSKNVFPSGNIELRRNARGTPSAMSSSES